MAQLIGDMIKGNEEIRISATEILEELQEYSQSEKDHEGKLELNQCEEVEASDDDDEGEDADVSN